MEIQASEEGKAMVSHGYLAALETGLRKNLSLPALKRLAKAVGGPVGKLLE